MKRRLVQLYFSAVFDRVSHRGLFFYSFLSFISNLPLVVLRIKYDFEGKITWEIEIS